MQRLASTRRLSSSTWQVLDVAHEDLDGDGTADLLHDLRTGQSVDLGHMPQELAVPQRGTYEKARAIPIRQVVA